MSDNSNPTLHRRAWDLIPWILNGSASSADCLAVDAHLNGCADCREELAFQRSLQTALQQQTLPTLDVQDAWRQLDARIEQFEQSTAPSHARSGARSWMPWAVAAMVIEAVAIGALGTRFWPPASTDALAANPVVHSYRTLSAPGGTFAPARIRAVFAPSMTLDQLQSLLSVSGLQIVAGPSSAKVWSLGSAAGASAVDVNKALRELRANPAVRFAEPIEDAP